MMGTYFTPSARSVDPPKGIRIRGSPLHLPHTATLRWHAYRPHHAAPFAQLAAMKDVLMPLRFLVGAMGSWWRDVVARRWGRCAGKRGTAGPQAKERGQG